MFKAKLIKSLLPLYVNLILGAMTYQVPDTLKLIDLIPSQIRQKTHLQTCSLALRERGRERARKSRFSRVGASQGPPGTADSSFPSCPGPQRASLLKAAQVSAQPTEAQETISHGSVWASLSVSVRSLAQRALHYLPLHAFIEH